MVYWNFCTICKVADFYHQTSPIIKSVKVHEKSIKSSSRNINPSLFITFQLDFDNVLAEPSGSQGFKIVFDVAMLVYRQTKSWFYKLFAAVLALPAALIWAIVFALLTIVYIWFICPALHLFDFFLGIMRKVSYAYIIYIIFFEDCYDQWKKIISFYR